MPTKILATLTTTTFAITLAITAAHRLTGQALAVLIGITSSAIAATLITLIITTSTRRTAASPSCKRSGVPLSPPHLVSSSPLPLPLSQIPSLTDAEHTLAQDQYWRGYRDGWIHAAQTMLDLTLHHQLPPETAYHTCQSHWQTLLPYWPHIEPVNSLDHPQSP